jgi:hypothetical protein
MNSPKIFIKQHPDAKESGPFNLEQVQKFVELKKIKSEAIFSLDQKTWHSATKSLNAFIKKYSTPKKSSSSENNDQQQPSSTNKSVVKPSTPKNKAMTGARRPSLPPRPSSPVKKKSIFGHFLKFLLLLIFLGLVGGGGFVYYQARETILQQADMAIEAFCRSLELDAKYTLNVSPKLDRIILSNVRVKNSEKHLDLQSSEIEVDTSVVMTMGWFLSDDIKIEQPKKLWAQIKSFQGNFVEDGYLYKAQEITLDFWGTFIKKENVIDGEIQSGEILLGLSDDISQKIVQIEQSEKTTLPREKNLLKIKFSGPFQNVSILEFSHEWNDIADRAFRAE